MSRPVTELPELVSAELPRLYAFAYVMCGARDEAFAHVREAMRGIDTAALLAAPQPGDYLFGQVARGIEGALGRKAHQSFVILDNLLRDETTQPIDPYQTPIDGDLSRVPVLLWELKRSCLASVLGCLPPGVRVSFVVTDMFGYPPAAAADLLGIKESAFRVRLTRARRRLEDYLAPRCGHVDNHNPCYCEGRLSQALQANFIGLPPHTDDVPATPYNGEPEHRDVAELYRSLPPVGLTAAQISELVAVVVGEPAV